MTRLSSEEIRREIAYHNYRASLEQAAIIALTDELARRERGETARTVSQMASAIAERRALTVMVPAAEAAR